ncbi:hypothetical protein DICPUDRAFT_91459 [Dictyostelium purpureum]|uniref:Uncharacterized protein n=1 Tax=Dictyostelium purpureum TaxID=5786 RepID=F0ZCR0_DICPU|nr:uncharacterized protein DICPUDRAFT_91459 [Dictyostelium purpureum]EGC38244.1 hypothetical protein DICPUDRAFT_91459 [Dictyostelium purpureum]|eukprot:XP_003285201.1 hypothetical protein DICPUDRAFT_91459 [Dictyostelium purpureum]
MNIQKAQCPHPYHDPSINCERISSWGKIIFEVPLEKGCTIDCLQKYLEMLDDEVKIFENVAKVYRSLKIEPDGTLPEFEFNDVINYYMGEFERLKNKNIQDLFNTNISELEFPGIPKAKDNIKL